MPDMNAFRMQKLKPLLWIKTITILTWNLVKRGRIWIVGLPRRTSSIHHDPCTINGNITHWAWSLWREHDYSVFEYERDETSANPGFWYPGARLLQQFCYVNGLGYRTWFDEIAWLHNIIHKKLHRRSQTSVGNTITFAR